MLYFKIWIILNLNFKYMLRLRSILRFGKIKRVKVIRKTVKGNNLKEQCLTHHK